MQFTEPTECWIVDLDSATRPGDRYRNVAHTTSLEAAYAVLETLNPTDVARGRYGLDVLEGQPE